MRQFLSPRFWLSIGAVVGLFALLVVVFGRSSPPTGVQASSDDGAHIEPRHLDLVQWVFQANPSAGFALDEGVTTSDLSLQLDGTRTMMIKAGTPGEITCPTLTQPATCTVAADLLGDAVLWFSLVPGKPGPTLTLPAVTDLLDNGWLELANGWAVRRANTVDRSCDEDTTSLNDFVRTYGENATSTFNFEQQQIVKVTCPRAGATTTTTTPTGGSSVTESTVNGGSVIVGGEEEDSGNTTPAPTTTTTG